MPENISLAEWALTYHRFGWQVMPCWNKEPLLTEWKYLTRFKVKEEVVINWWKQWPYAQIALVCGELSGVTVVDVDWLKDEHHQCLYETSTPPSDFVQRIPGVLASKTGSDGRHLFFKYFYAKNSTKAIHPQLDVRSEGGYVILPPSPHESGNAYAWNQGSYNDALLEPPSKLLEACKAVRTEPKDWERVLSGVGSGSRNTTGAQIAGALIRAFRSDLGTAWSIFGIWNRGNIPPMGEDELKKIFKSVMKTDYANNARFYQ